ncbi:MULTISPECIES: ParB/RepB/Spo0J family partition protein [Nitrospirillum]|uniref:ParB family chromosome partitioning protein n=1 Tax=Nitrospirillum amazonense TaxID=28077 RepID=A0A560EUI6_9PROT|nr:ParB/RepB/Spo0J family partition protein [Nitrospirillum amazonense]MEC4590206.1 ParB/RepB/Spo0J family partition protein [Nitrospirillum amazonense]TWB13007.1 ParB family chromosome partitioning protein [Nitrospirillum amazonense]
MTVKKRPSPILGAASAMIGEASGELVMSRDSRFHHSIELQVDHIAPDPEQPRKLFSEEELDGLAASMAEQGQLQPILVRRNPTDRGRWVVVAGERRWRAAQRLGWGVILAIEHTGDPEVLALIENLQRVDLTPVEEARGLKRLIDGKGWTQNQAAEALGKTKGEISATLRILSLPEDILEGVLTSELGLSRNVLVELSRVDEPAVRERLIQSARSGTLSIRTIRAAKAQDQAPEVVEGKPSTGITTPGVNLASVERLVSNLRALRPAALKDKDRDRLRALRAAIDALLG